MYSILIKVSSKNYIYDANEEGEVFSGDETEVKARYIELLAEYPSSKLTIVHNVEVTNDLTIVDIV